MSANRNSVEWMCASNVGCGSLLRSHTYAYDGWNLILEQIAHAGGVTDVIEYFWGSDLSGSEQGAGGVGGLVALAINGAFYFPCYDQNGNVTEYVDESGSIAAQFAYDAFGNLLATDNSERTTLLSIRFSTKYLDPETGFYYYGYRYYNPELGRWLTRDPIEEQGGLNLYGFCGNDAVNRWDKLGMKCLIVEIDFNSPANVFRYHDQFLSMTLDEGVAAFSTIMQRVSYDTMINCGADKYTYTTEFKPPVCIIYIIYRTKNASTIRAENEHVLVWNELDDAYTKFKKEIESIYDNLCKANRKYERALKKLKLAVEKADAKTEALDRPGGPHGGF